MKSKILLHTCCGPCLSQSLLALLKKVEYKKSYFENIDFEIFVFFDNPNIYSIEEYLKRKKEVEKIINIFYKEYKENIDLLETDYKQRKSIWERETCYFKNDPERGKRCQICYKLRIEETFKIAKKLNFEKVATTLTLSPLKDTLIINQIGKELEEKYRLSYLITDFKKDNGVKNSIDFCKKYGIYRQNFCGCEYSIRTDTQ